MQLIKTTFAILAAGILAGCATTQTPEAPGRFMAVRDLSGKLLMQFDYPTDDLCARTSRAMRGTIYQAGCSGASAANSLQARATLRYNPPGVQVEGHYVDLAACRTQISQPSAGVDVMQTCSTK